MPATASSVANGLKEVWTDNELIKQFNTDDGPLSRLENIRATMIGSLASVPIGSDISAAGFVQTTAAGGNLAAPGNQPSLKAQYSLTYPYFSIGLEVGAIAQANGSDPTSIFSAKDQEVEGALESMRNQLTREVVTNGDGIVAQCGTSNSATVALVPSPSGTAYGYDAIIRNWLRPGMVVDVGITADTDALVTGATVLSVDDTPGAPTVTLDSSISTTAGTHFIYVQNPNSATASNPELNGLRNMVGNGALGGLNPATAGQENWKAARRDTTTTIPSLDLFAAMSRDVRQKSGKREVAVWSGLKQHDNYWLMLQNSQRWVGNGQMNAGPNDAGNWNGIQWEAFNAILDSDVFFLDLKSFGLVKAAGIPNLTWFSKLMGFQQGMFWKVRTTAFEDAIVYPLQVVVKRRNNLAAALALTA